jgi:hypothetical protein
VNASEARAEVEPQKQAPKKPSFQVPITNRVSTPQVLPDFRANWYKFSQAEKDIRMAQVERARDLVLHNRQHIDNPDTSIAACAKRLVKRHSDELRKLGFFIPGLAPKGKA